MSYCVNCGVELADSEKYCPLCGVEVINPASPWKEPADRPYPSKMERVLKRADRKYYVTVGALLMLLPPLISLFSDIVENHEVTWSAYVVAGVALMYVVGFTPFSFSKPRPLLCISFDCLTLIPFLFVIMEASGGDWFLSLGLPLVVTVWVHLMIGAWIFSRKKPSLLRRGATICFLIATCCGCVEQILSFYSVGMPLLNWSPYVFSPCVIMGIAALVLDHRRKLHDAVKKRFFV